MTEPNDDNVAIWRYMSFTKFISILAERGKLYFARPFKFDDKWEGLVPPSYYRNLKRYAKVSGTPFDEADLKLRIKRSRYGHFVSCWHISDDESEAMWRLYGLSNEGVAIQSTKGDSRECFVRIDGCGDVVYYDPKNNITYPPFSGPSNILHKRIHFSSEKEFRIWRDDVEVMDKISRNEEIDEKDLSSGEFIQISDMERFVKRVVVAPRASDSFFNLVKSVCGAYGKTWLVNKLERSYLDRLYDSFCAD